MKGTVLIFAMLFTLLLGAGGAESAELNASQVRLLNKIKIAYGLKPGEAREKAFIDLFYLKGADSKTKNVTVKVMWVRSLMMFKNPKITFKDLPKNFKQAFISKGKGYIYNLRVLGRVGIEGQIGDSMAQFQNFYGKSGDEPFFSVPVAVN